MAWVIQLYVMFHSGITLRYYHVIATANPNNVPSTSASFYLRLSSPFLGTLCQHLYQSSSTQVPQTMV